MKTGATTPEMKTKAPPADPGIAYVAFLPEDLKTFANLMSVVTKTFEKMAMDAAQLNDDASFSVFQARCRLSAVLADRLIDACKMPEPESRDIH